MSTKLAQGAIILFLLTTIIGLNGCSIPTDIGSPFIKEIPITENITSADAAAARYDEQFDRVLRAIQAAEASHGSPTTDNQTAATSDNRTETAVDNRTKATADNRTAALSDNITSKKLFIKKLKNFDKWRELNTESSTPEQKPITDKEKEEARKRYNQFQRHIFFSQIKEKIINILHGRDCRGHVL